MSNEQIANKIVRNFLNQHPSMTFSALITTPYYTLSNIFTWRLTPEGSFFWNSACNILCLYNSDIFHNFLVKYYKPNQKLVFINLLEYQ